MCLILRHATFCLSSALRSATSTASSAGETRTPFPEARSRPRWWLRLSFNTKQTTPPLLTSGPEKGVIPKGVFSLEESLESLNYVESLENGRILLYFPESGDSLKSLESLNSLESLEKGGLFWKDPLFQKTPFSEPDCFCLRIWQENHARKWAPCGDLLRASANHDLN